MSNESGEIYIEFDGRQLVVRTGIPMVRSFIEDTFKNMLAPRVTHYAGALAILRKGEGFRIESGEARSIPGDEGEYLLSAVREEVRIEFMRSRLDLLWLHAAVVERDGRAMLLCGPSGQGKSTLSTLLCERGWRLMSDDAAPVRMDRDEVLAYPQTPVKRVARDRVREPNKRKGLERQRVSLDTARFRLEPAEIGCAAFLEFIPGEAASIRALLPGETALEILRNASNLVDHRANGMTRAAAMARSLPGFLLQYGYSPAAAEILDALP